MVGLSNSFQGLYTLIVALESDTMETSLVHCLAARALLLVLRTRNNTRQ